MALAGIGSRSASRRSCLSHRRVGSAIGGPRRPGRRPGHGRIERAADRGSGHDLEALATPLLRAEALGSSFIEGFGPRTSALLSRPTNPSRQTPPREQYSATSERWNGDRDRHRATPSPPQGRARHPQDAVGRHDRRALRRSRAHRAELDRWPWHEPARCYVHPSPAGSCGGTPRRPHLVRESRRLACHRTGHDCARTVRDHPPFRRRQRARRAMPHPRDPATTV